MAMQSTTGAPRKTAAKAVFWRDPNIRAIFWQVLVVGIVAVLVWLAVRNVTENMERQRIASGFGFLGTESGFDIGDTLIPYDASNTYARAIWVGILNTLRVAVLGIILATILGTVIGIGRLSRNFLVAKICTVYVEMIRNIPLLLQLFVWYKLLQIYAPRANEATSHLGIYVSQRGVQLPVPLAHPIHEFMGFAFLLAIAATYLVGRWARARQARTGEQFHTVWTGIGLIIGLPLIVWLVGGAPIAMSWPEFKGFNFVGGANIAPELTALLIGLTIYTAAFIAEIVRAGILAVNKGQSEAAAALGLRSGTTMRLVILPQALRVIIPPMTSQYLNITKNSSLAIAIGYPDIVAILNTTMNQTGQAIEGTLLIMACYLTVSLSISLFMNWYNKRIALVER